MVGLGIYFRTFFSVYSGLVPNCNRLNSSGRARGAIGFTKPYYPLPHHSVACSLMIATTLRLHAAVPCCKVRLYPKIAHGQIGHSVTRRAQFCKSEGRRCFVLCAPNSSMVVACLKQCGLTAAYNNQRPCARWCTTIGVHHFHAQSRAFRFRCRCRQGKSASRRAYSHGPRAVPVFLLSSGSILFPAMSREHEARRVLKKNITFFTWKQAALQFRSRITISNESGVYRHQLHIRGLCTPIRIL